MKRFLKSSVSDIQCLYLINIGKVSEWKHLNNIADNIDDNYIICKYGRSEDLDRRLKDHVKTYGNQITVITYAMIDEYYLSEAEAELRNSYNMTENNLIVDWHNELIYISESKIKNIIKYYKSVQSKYCGSHRQLLEKQEKI